MSARHEPVLVAEVLHWLRAGAGLYLDGTLGDGGHAEALLDAEPGARLLGGDRDLVSLAFARERLARFGDRVNFFHATFRELPAAYDAQGREPFTGALLDLGLSSRQLDDPTRGLSFMTEGPLDLRLDASRGRPAWEEIRDVSVETLAKVLHELGDVPGAMRIARALNAAALAGALRSTRDLVATMDATLGGRAHPRRYAQVFQALRIWVNGEHEDLDAVLAWLPSVMKSGGVVVMLSYHSGEDRRVKHALRGERPIVSRRHPLPETAAAAPVWEPLHRGVITPSVEEVARNPRARSARMRAFRRIGS